MKSETSSGASMHASLFGSCVVFFSVLAVLNCARAEDIKAWVCKAEGQYTTCTASRSWRPCQEYRAEGVGIAEEKFAAGLQAEEVCSENMIELMKIGKVSGSTSVKALCTRTVCEPSWEPLENLQSLRTRIPDSDETALELEQE